MRFFAHVCLLICAGFWNIPLVMAGLLLITATAIARPLPQEPAPPAAPPNAPADVKPAAETDDSPKELNEQTIYIPYEKLRAVFEKEGRGVFLPYEKFQALWEAAQKHSKQAAPPKVPVSAVIRAIDSQAKIGKQIVDVEATLEIELIGKGWIAVPLRLRQSAIRSAIIDGKSARVVFDAAKGYSLLHHKQTSTSETLRLSLNYSRTFTKSPGKSDVAFEPPQSPINRWLVSIPEKDVNFFAG